MNRYPRETVEFQPVEVKLDGAPVTENVVFAVTHNAARPTSWVAPVVVGDEIGVMVENLAHGTWMVWARVTSIPEAPVIRCGSFWVD